MKIVTSLEEIPPATSPIALTIGIFDGIHLGHQEIIKELHKLTRRSGTRVLLTFSNHPSHILNPDKPVSLLMSFEHRLHFLERYGIDLAIALPFTREFSEQSYEAFLKTLHEKLPFNELVLGEGATFGKDCKGDAEHLAILAQKMGFKIHYMKKERYHKDIISSHLLRSLVKKRKLKKIKKLLGRPYSIWKRFDSFAVTKENVALYSWSFEETQLCMLPSGVYGIDFEIDGGTLPAIAFLRSSEDLSGSHLFVTVYLEKQPPSCLSVNLSFIEYLHSEIDPTLFQSPPRSILENLSAQHSLS